MVVLRLKAWDRSWQHKVKSAGDRLQHCKISLKTKKLVLRSWCCNGLMRYVFYEPFSLVTPTCWAITYTLSLIVLMCTAWMFCVHGFHRKSRAMSFKSKTFYHTKSKASCTFPISPLCTEKVIYQELESNIFILFLLSFSVFYLYIIVYLPVLVF